MSARKSQPELATVVRACELLKTAAQGGEGWSLSGLARASGIEMTAAFRLVKTLEGQGLLRKVDGRHYVSCVQWEGEKRLRVGYAQQGSASSFSRTVTEGLRWAAERRKVELLVFDNAESGANAYRNAKKMREAGVQVAVQFQIMQRMANRVAEVYEATGIPVIAVDIPHPGAAYFGIENYRAGRLAGQRLAAWAEANWAGEVEEVVLLELSRAGTLPNARLVGVEDALREKWGMAARCTRLDTRGDFASGSEVMRHFLRRNPVRRTLLSAVSERALLGAVSAWEEAGRGNSVRAIGVGGLEEVRREMRRENSAVIGSVSAFPEKYGDEILALAMGAAKGMALPIATYAELEVLTRENLWRYYPLET